MNANLRRIIEDEELMCKNILSIWERCSAQEIEEGRIWYPETREWCVGVAQARGVEDMKAIGVLAALSPQKDFEGNKKITVRYLEGDKRVHTGVMVGKCDRIVTALSKEEIDDILHGEKIKNFFNNILEPDNPEWVTIDRHALDLALRIANSGRVREKQYRKVANAYFRAARKLREHPCSVQAATWLTWRKLKRNI